MTGVACHRTSSIAPEQMTNPTKLTLHRLKAAFLIIWDKLVVAVCGVEDSYEAVLVNLLDDSSVSTFII